MLEPGRGGGQCWSLGGCRQVAGTSTAMSVVRRKVTDCFQAISGINMACSTCIQCQSIQCGRLDTMTLHPVENLVFGFFNFQYLL